MNLESLVITNNNLQSFMGEKYTGKLQCEIQITNQTQDTLKNKKIRSIINYITTLQFTFLRTKTYMDTGGMKTLYGDFKRKIQKNNLDVVLIQRDQEKAESKVYSITIRPDLPFEAFFLQAGELFLQNKTIIEEKNKSNTYHYCQT